ncbi:MAG: hypothetical protein SF097_26340 [Acidobacteriota bacterium]|nr:hypothetical protein [Acidobacteriota bacterium]
MRKILSAILVTAICCSAVWLGGEAVVYGQQTTEQFIPMGKSPGVSGKYAWMGEIDQVDEQNRTITVKTDSASKTIKLTDKTRIWLDRSKQRASSTKADFSELKKGRKVEVKYVKDRESEAEWIKIEVAQ